MDKGFDYSATPDDDPGLVKVTLTQHLEALKKAGEEVDSHITNRNLSLAVIAVPVNSALLLCCVVGLLDYVSFYCICVMMLVFSFFIFWCFDNDEVDDDDDSTVSNCNDFAIDDILDDEFSARRQVH